MAEFTVSCETYVVLLHTCLTWVLAIDNEEEKFRRLARLECTREHMRNVCSAAGIKLMTMPCAQMWQVLTAVKLSVWGGITEHECLLPFEAMAPRTTPLSITAICHVPYITAGHFEASIATVEEIWPLSAKSCAAGQWVSDVKSVLCDMKDIVQESHSRRDVLRFLTKQ